MRYLAEVWGHKHSGHGEWPHLARGWLVFHTGAPLQGFLFHSSLASSVCFFEIALCLPLALRQYLHPVQINLLHLLHKAPSQSIILIIVTYQPWSHILSLVSGPFSYWRRTWHIQIATSHFISFQPYFINLSKHRGVKEAGSTTFSTIACVVAGLEAFATLYQ